MKLPHSACGVIQVRKVGRIQLSFRFLTLKGWRHGSAGGGPGSERVSGQIERSRSQLAIKSLPCTHLQKTDVSLMLCCFSWCGNTESLPTYNSLVTLLLRRLSLQFSPLCNTSFLELALPPNSHSPCNVAP